MNRTLTQPLIDMSRKRTGASVSEKRGEQSYEARPTRVRLINPGDGVVECGAGQARSNAQRGREVEATTIHP